MTDEVNERLAQRFQSDKNEENEQSKQNDQKEKNEVKAKNVKKEWNARSVYLPDGLTDDLELAWNQLKVRFAEDGQELDLQKTRHFYPLVIRVGIDGVRERRTAELVDLLEDLEEQP